MRWAKCNVIAFLTISELEHGVSSITGKLAVATLLVKSKHDETTLVSNKTKQHRRLFSCRLIN